MADLYKLRSIIRNLNEASTKDSTRTYQNINIDKEKEGNLSKDSKSTSIDNDMKTSSYNRTNINMPQGSGDVMRHFLDALADLDDTVEVKNEPAEVQPVNFEEPEIKPPNTLPAVINKGLTQKDPNYKPNSISLKWFKLKELPGYFVQQIRGAFRPLFTHILGKQLEELQVATTLTGDSYERMKHVIGFLETYGIRDDDFSLSAFNIDPEKYHIERATVYAYSGWSFLVLKEKLMGNTNYYIYAGPGGRATDLESKHNQEKISNQNS